MLFKIDYKVYFYEFSIMNNSSLNPPPQKKEKEIDKYKYKYKYNINIIFKVYSRNKWRLSE